jgi:three-Cys-motif partner protein
LLLQKPNGGKDVNKMVKHEFGGDWTEDKLTCLQKYLEAYRKIFSKNLRAQYFTTYYVDAFAGPGFRNSSSDQNEDINLQLFEEDEIVDIQNYFKGSVIKALELAEPFHKYLFIDKNSEYIDSLKKIRNEHPNVADRIQIENAEANEYLIDWCSRMDWNKNRAVVFLDPYGMQVDWRLIEALGKTRAVDMWLLFPLGVAVNRLLTRKRMPPAIWASRLTRTFGTDSWKDFYTKGSQMTLFGDEPLYQKNVSLQGIEEFITHRLSEVFPNVAKSPLKLMNSKNNPLYLLCFTSTKPVGVNIAEDIMWNLDGSGYGCK